MKPIEAVAPLIAQVEGLRGDAKQQLVRYARTGCSDISCMCGGTMEEDNDGDWVKWEAVQKILNK